jgi:hypothetical protein
MERTLGEATHPPDRDFKPERAPGAQDLQRAGVRIARGNGSARKIAPPLDFQRSRNTFGTGSGSRQPRRTDKIRLEASDAPLRTPSKRSRTAPPEHSTPKPSRSKIFTRPRCSLPRLDLQPDFATKSGQPLSRSGARRFRANRALWLPEHDFPSCSHFESGEFET